MSDPERLDQAGALPPHLVEAIAGVPSFDAFWGVDALNAAFAELAAAQPERVTLRRFGTSRLGEPMSALTVAAPADRPHAVVFAFPHPNEPIGGLTALHLARQLCAGAAPGGGELTWHIVPCIDPDGTRLNESWFAGPLTRSFYGRRFYRPPGHEQVEWTFPFSYKRAYFDRVLPETQALLRLIDDARPIVMCSLHNGEYGGVYYYLSRPCPELYPALHGVAHQVGLPLDTGEPEVPYVEQLAPAIFGMIRREDGYDFVESVGLDPTDHLTGDSSAAYANRYGTLSIVSELPYWTHADADDATPLDTTYAEVLRQQAAGLRDMHAALQPILDAFATEAIVDSPFLRASQAFIPHMADGATSSEHRAADPASGRPATVAERFGCGDLVHCFRLRFGGMLLRALDGELAVGHGTPTVRDLHGRMSELYDRWATEADGDLAGEPIPIAKLVAVQYAAILAAAEHALRTSG